MPYAPHHVGVLAATVTACVLGFAGTAAAVPPVPGGSPASGGRLRVSAATPATTDQAPGLPADPSTSPGGPCRTGDPSATMIGRNSITFQVTPSDPDGGNVNVEFVIQDYNGGVVYDSGDPATGGITSPVGVPARLVIDSSRIEGWHPDGATTPHAYSWYTRVSDGQLYGPATGLGSAGSPCTFTYDPTSPDAPGVKVTTGGSGNVGTLGQKATLTVAPCAGALAASPTACTGTAPGKYTYRVDLDPMTSGTVAATGGVQTIQFPLHHVGPNTVTVTAFTAAGNVASSSAGFDVRPPATPYTDGDVDGDGHPDLLAAGPAAYPGLWLARGDGAGHLSSPIDIGAAGTGVNASGSPSDWNGAQVLHGDFTGNHVQDVLAYFPTGNDAGGGVLLYGNGDDLPLSPYSGSQMNINSGTFADYTLNPNGDNPIQLVAGGNASVTATGIPDLIGITGDSADGYQLDLYTAPCGCAFGYFYAQTLAGPADSPDGKADWSDFSLVTAQPDGKAVLFALKKSTGELWESTNPSQSSATPIGTPASAGGTWIKIDVPWRTDAVPTLLSGDINTAGAVELWAQTGATTVTPYVLTGAALKKETAHPVRFHAEG